MKASKPGRIISCKSCLVALTGEADIKYNTQFYHQRIYQMVLGWDSRTAPKIVLQDAVADLSGYLKENIKDINDNLWCRSELERNTSVNGDLICCIYYDLLYFFEKIIRIESKTCKTLI